MKYFKYIFFTIAFFSNQANSINLLDIALKVLFFSAVVENSEQVSSLPPYAQWVKNVKYPLGVGGLPNFKRVRRCPEPDTTELGYMIKIVCNTLNPKEYTCLQVDDRYEKDVFVEQCSTFKWITEGFRPLWRGKLMVDYKACKPPFSDPRRDHIPHITSDVDMKKISCNFREEPCVSEGQVIRTDPAVYNSTKLRQMCACAEGYLPMESKGMKYGYSPKVGFDQSCYRNVTGIKFDDLITKDEIINSPFIHIDDVEVEELYDRLSNLTKDSIFPPILLISGGMPFLIVIPLCLLRYSVASDDTSETNDENNKKFKAMYTDDHGNKVTFECTVKISSVEGRLELDGSSCADTNESGGSFFQKAFSTLSGSSGSNRGGNISVVSNRLLAIKSGDEKDSCDNVHGACSMKDIQTTKINKTGIKEKSNNDFANKKESQKNSKGLLCVKRKKQAKREVKEKNINQKRGIEVHEEEKTYLKSNTCMLIKKYENIDKPVLDKKGIRKHKVKDKKQKSGINVREQGKSQSSRGNKSDSTFEVRKELLAIEPSGEEGLCDYMRGACSIKDSAIKKTIDKELVNKYEKIQEQSVGITHKSRTQTKSLDGSKKTKDIIKMFES